MLNTTNSTLSPLFNIPTPPKINAIPEYNGLPLWCILLSQHYTQQQINAHSLAQNDSKLAFNDLLTNLINNGNAYITDPLTGEILWELSSQGA